MYHGREIIISKVQELAPLNSQSYATMIATERAHCIKFSRITVWM